MGVPADKHDGTDGNSATTDETADDDASHTNAEYATAADASNTTAADDDVYGTDASQDVAAPTGTPRPENTAAGSAIPAVCRFCDGINHGGPCLMVSGGPKV